MKSDFADQVWPVERQPVDGQARNARRWLEASVASGALAVLRNLPEPLLDAFVGIAARGARRLDRRHADAARRFLDVALGPLEHDEREARVLEAFRHFLRVTVEADQIARMTTAERRKCIEIDVPDRTYELARAKAGCLISTAHLGNWEVGAAALPLLGFRSVYVVGKPPKNYYLSQKVQQLREDVGVRLLPRRGAMAAAPKILEAGGCLGLLLDQRARTRPIRVPFFGRPARCDRSAGVLIRRLKVPLIVVFAYRVARERWRFESPAILEPESFSDQTPEQITARINSIYETAILRRPEQYFWLHDRYKDTPLAD